MLNAFELLALAEKMRARAYAPYSRYRVGAALLCADGKVYTGCNIENASYGACLCAERAAIAAAVCDGNREFLTLAVSGSGEGLCTPCGICRQIIFEFSPACRVICGCQKHALDPLDECCENDESTRLTPLVTTSEALLPMGFGPKSLRNLL